MVTKNTSRKPAARAVQAARRSGAKLSRPEIQKLVLQARDAFGYQTALGAIDAGTTFDAWRREQVQAAVGLDGLSKIGREHWRTVSAHFLTLAGEEDAAFLLLQKTGTKSYRPAGAQDTHENAEALAAHIRQALEEHAKFPAADLQPGKSHITPGWFLVAARQRTGKPTLTMDSLANRLDPETLVGLLSHLRNHIARRECRDTDRRAARRYPKKADPGEMDDPF